MKKKFFTKFLMVIAMLFGLVVTGGNLAVNAAAESTTASKTVEELITEYGWTDTTTKQSFNLDENVSVKINGGTNTGKAYDGDHIRIYATDSPAGSITISVPKGYELESVTISTKTGTYAFLYVDGTTTDISNTPTSVSGEFVLLTSVKNGSNGKQVRVTAFEVTYKAPAVSDHTCEFNQQVAEDTYLERAADCENPATYFLSCTCEKKVLKLSKVEKL